MSKPKRKKPEPVPWNEALDEAVMKRFPDVTCETYWNIFSGSFGGWQTRWWQAGTEDTKLKPALARQVGSFVAGFMAAVEHEGIAR